MEWWKATLLTIVAYLLLSLVGSFISVGLAVLLNLIPIIGFVIGILIGFIVTALVALFAGFVGGTLSDNLKPRVGLIGCLIGGIIETLVKVFALFSLTAFAGGLSYFTLNQDRFPILAAIIVGGFIGMAYLAIMSIGNIVISSVCGWTGGRISVETSKKKPKKPKNKN